MTSCGTDMETSLPCIFSPWGRRLRRNAHPQTANRCSMWRPAPGSARRVGDKPVRLGRARGRIAAPRSGQITGGTVPAANADAALVDSVEASGQRNAGQPADRPAPDGQPRPRLLQARYPDASGTTPACEDNSDLPRCSNNESIVNAYDNAIRYTDHVVASLVRTPARA